MEEHMGRRELSKEERSLVLVLWPSVIPISKLCVSVHVKMEFVNIPVTSVG